MSIYESGKQRARSLPDALAAVAYQDSTKPTIPSAFSSIHPIVRQIRDVLTMISPKPGSSCTAVHPVPLGLLSRHLGWQEKFEVQRQVHRYLEILEMVFEVQRAKLCLIELSMCWKAGDL